MYAAYCESHADNSFISCCTVFSKDHKQVTIPTQTCNIVINNKELSIFYGIRVKINIFVHFDIDKLDKFIAFLIKSYTFVKTGSNIASIPQEDDSLLDVLTYNLQTYENEYLKTQCTDNNNIFTLEILEKNIVIKNNKNRNDYEDEDDENIKLPDTTGMKLSLIFTNYLIAAYYFNRFSKVITLDKQDYKILILPLDTELINPNLKRIQTTVLEAEAYIHYQISKQISFYGNQINVFSINKRICAKELEENDKYYVLFHPNTVIDSKYSTNYEREYNNVFTDTLKIIKHVKREENNHNINWFVLGSSLEDKCFIRCFRFNLATMHQKLNVSNKDKCSVITHVKCKSEIEAERKKAKNDRMRKEQRVRTNENRDKQYLDTALRINNNSTLDKFFNVKKPLKTLYVKKQQEVVLAQPKKPIKRIRESDLIIDLPF